MKDVIFTTRMLYPAFAGAAIGAGLSLAFTHDIRSALGNAVFCMGVMWLIAFAMVKVMRRRAA